MMLRVPTSWGSPSASFSYSAMASLTRPPRTNFSACSMTLTRSLRALMACRPQPSLKEVRWRPGRPLLPQRPEVFFRSVALVPGQAVAFVEGVERPHEPVPEDLGHDGGRGDRPGFPVALRDAHLAVLYLFYREPVNQEDVGGVGQALDGPDHGQLGGPVDVQDVDLGGGGQAHADARGLPQEGGGQLDAPGRGRGAWNR